MSAEHQAYVERWRDTARARKVQDWRVVLLPAAIKAGASRAVMRVADAVCDHQQAGGHLWPQVWVGHDELAEELGMDEHDVRRALQWLVRHRLLTVELGGGRLSGTKSARGKANTYRLGGACGRRLKGGESPPVSQLVTGVNLPPLSSASELLTGVDLPPHPYGVLRTPPGDRGKRTVALTGDPTPIQPSSEAIAPHRFRDLLRAFSSVSKGFGSTPGGASAR